MDNEKVQEELKKVSEKKVKSEKSAFKSKEYETMNELLSYIKDNFGIDLEPSNNAKYKLLKAIDYLESKYEMVFNVINTDLDIKRKEEKEFKYFDDMEYNDMFLDIKLNLGFNLSKADFETIIYSSKVAKRFNPFKDYLFNIPKWDGQDHITEFLKQIKLKDEDHREYLVEGFKKWFVALVVSLVEDQPHAYYINQTCFILMGGQSRYKTTFLKNIVPKNMQMKYYYGANFQMHNKDHEKYLAYKMLINLDEMASLHKSDIESVKSKITQDQVVVRLPYARRDVHLKRRASFCGTINNKEFLRDETGTRRFFTVEIEDIDLNDSYNIDKIYAQALDMYKNGFRYWFDKDDIKLIELHNQDFSLKGFEEEYLLTYLKVPSEKDQMFNQVDYMTASGIADYIKSKVDNININNTVVKNLGLALSKNGFTKVSKRLNGTVTKLWAVKKITETQITDIDSPVTEEVQEEFPI